MRKSNVTLSFFDEQVSVLCSCSACLSVLSLSFFFPLVDNVMTLCVCVCVSAPQWSTTGSCLHSGVTTESSSSTPRRSPRARPSPQQSSASIRSAWATPSTTTPSYLKSTRWSRSTLTGTYSHDDTLLRQVGCGVTFVVIQRHRFVIMRHPVWRICVLTVLWVEPVQCCAAVVVGISSARTRVQLKTASVFSDLFWIKEKLCFK